MSETTKPGCVFCDIVTNELDQEKLLYKDEHFVVIRDIRPKAPIHFLVLSRKHIDNINDIVPKASFYSPLPPKDYLAKMRQVGESVVKSELEKSQDTFTGERLRVGFHRPPFHSVLHLHLHLIYPAEQINWIGRIFYAAKAPWFLPVDSVINELS